MASKTIKVEVSGIAEIERAFEDLKKALAKKVIRQAIREALRPMHAEAQRNAPYDTGTLAKSIILRAQASRKRGAIAFEIRSGEHNFMGKSYYAGMVEFGTRKMPAQPFMRPAFDDNKDAAIARARRFILEGVERELAAGKGKVKR